jgi:hypothetical protein
VIAWATSRGRYRGCVGFGCTTEPRPGQIPGGAVVVALGGVRDGFRRPITVVRYRRNGPDVDGVAVSNSGAVFVAWSRFASSPEWIARVSRHGATRPRVLLSARADLLGLTSGLDGPILVSWEVYHRRRGSTVYDAPLLASGRLGPARRLVFEPASGLDVDLAFNDRAAAVVAWQKMVSERNNTSSPAEVTLCPPSGRCGPTRTVRLGPRGPQTDASLAATLTDAGTAVIASDATVYREGPNTPLGVWAAVSHNGGRFEPEQRVSAAGNSPDLAAVGRDGVVMIYNPPRPAPAALWDAPEVAVLDPGQQQFRHAGRYPGPSSGDGPALITGAGGNTFAAYWATANSRSARIAVGTLSGIGTPHRIGFDYIPLGSLDGRGDMLTAWSGNHEVKLDTALTG